MILLKLIQAVGDEPRGRRFTQTNSISYQPALLLSSPARWRVAAHPDETLGCWRTRGFISALGRIVLLSVHKKNRPPFATQNNETNYLSYLSFLHFLSPLTFFICCGVCFFLSSLTYQL